MLRCLSACKCQRSQYTSLPPSRQALRARAPACPHISPCPLCLFVPMSLCLSVPISLSLSRGCPAARHGRVRAINQYRGSSLIRKLHPLGPYSRPMPRALSWSLGGGALSYEGGTPVSLSQHLPADFQKGSSPGLVEIARESEAGRESGKEERDKYQIVHTGTCIEHHNQACIEHHSQATQASAPQHLYRGTSLITRRAPH